MLFCSIANLFKGLVLKTGNEGLKLFQGGKLKKNPSFGLAFTETDVVDTSYQLSMLTRFFI